MKFERNTVIGFILLAILFFGFFWFNSQEQSKQQAWQKEQNRIKYVADSTKRAQDSTAQAKSRPQQPTVEQQQVPTASDSAGFKLAFKGTEVKEEVNTDLLRIIFTNKGGQPQLVELKKFKGPDSTNVKMGSTDFDKITYKIEADKGVNAGIDSLYFPPAEKKGQS